jgi:hypothetical protein
MVLDKNEWQDNPEFMESMRSTVQSLQCVMATSKNTDSGYEMLRRRLGNDASCGHACLSLRNSSKGSNKDK